LKKKILGTLADVLEQARSLQDLSFGMRALEKEPRIVDALISGCPKVHTIYLSISSWIEDDSERYGILARLFNQVRWPLRTAYIMDAKLEIVPSLAQFAGTLEEVFMEVRGVPFDCTNVLVFPRVAKLKILFWDCYYRMPLVKAFPAGIYLDIYTSFPQEEYRRTLMDEFTDRLGQANPTDVQPCEGWEYLDYAEGNVLVIHALTVPSRASVRRLCLSVNVDFPRSVTRLCSTLEALRPIVLELFLDSEDDVDLKSLWDTCTPNVMASVRCLDLQTSFLSKREYNEGWLELYEFTVC
jgi:hypothetical protein